MAKTSASRVSAQPADNLQLPRLASSPVKEYELLIDLDHRSPDAPATKLPKRCEVPKCGGKQTDHRLICNDCFAALPDGAQFQWRYISRSDGAVVGPRQLAQRKALAKVAIRRLACRHAGPLDDVEKAEADELCRRFHSFGTLAELLAAGGDYWPKWDLVDTASDAETRELTARLADFYDRSQIERGDSRRAGRAGMCGL